MKKYNFIFISTADWDNPFWTNKQHMAKILSEQGHKVVYFDSLGLREPVNKSQKDRKRIFRRLIKFFKGAKKINDNLYVFSPVIIPKHDNFFISKLNNTLMFIYLKLISMKHFKEDPIYWTYNPLSGDFLTKNKIVYHCVDDLTAAPGMPVKKIRSKEIELILKSSITFVTSKTLKEKLLPIAGDKLFYFPNVADVAHFSKALLDLPKPLDLQKLNGPILGFVGAISSYKVDFHLLVKLAHQFPMAQIILIGEVGEGQPDTSVDIFKNNPNIHLLGPKAYLELPFYLKYMDVALLPCVLNDYTSSMFPMKFFEYLAAEKKVVSTNLESLIDFKDSCYLANSDEDFIAGVTKALTMSLEDFCNVPQMKRAVVENTWENRTKRMLDILDQSI